MFLASQYITSGVIFFIQNIAYMFYAYAIFLCIVLACYSD